MENRETSSKRLHVVDALRGFAIISIMLLHNIEHFDLYFVPESLPMWMETTDKIIWDSLFFLFGGKAFAIFALLFGITYFIQTDNQQKKGSDFRLRFAWRMILLLGFGLVNSAFFQGDILAIYAVLGLFLIPLTNLGNKVLLAVVAFLLMQPIELISLFRAIQNPEMQIASPESWTYFGRSAEYLSDDSLYTTIKGNLTNGRKAVLLWNYENGRYFQILSLFIAGYVLGRKKWFAWSEENKQKWTKLLVLSVSVFLPLFVISGKLETLIGSVAIRQSLSVILTSWTNLSFMFVLVSFFTLIFHTGNFNRILNKISPVGKMSLSNYIFQSIVGSAIYYGSGLGLYKYTGATYSILIGIILSGIFIYLCSLWNKYYHHGPLESIWHKLTWINFPKKLNPEKISGGFVNQRGQLK